MITINHAQHRLARDWQSALFRGRDWDLIASEDVFVDPITQTAMLLPLPLTEQFRTSASGDYARLRKSDTNRSSASEWTEYQRGFAGNYYLHSVGLADNDPLREVRTTATYTKNRGFFVAFFAYNYGADDYVQLECGWGHPGGEQVELRVWSSGQVEVWKNNVFVGRHTLAGERDGSEESPQQTIPNREVKLLMLPCRRRSLLVLTNQGNGFEHVFDDLDPDSPGNAITPDGSLFYCYIPLGQATFQFCPVRYRTAGKLLTATQTLITPPPTGTTVSATAFADQAGYGTSSATASLRLPDDSGAFVPDDTSTNYRLRVALTGDGTTTHFIYGAQATVDGEIALTDDNPTSLDSYTRHWSLSVQPTGQASMTVELQRLNALEILVPQLRTQSYLPAQVEQSSIVWLDGVGNITDWREAIADEIRTATLEISDLTRLLETYLYRDAFALDGLAFEDALTLLLTRAGIDTSMIALTATGYNLPTEQSASKGEFALQVNVGDSAWGWVRKLHDRFGADRIFGFRPTTAGIKFISEVWDSLPTTPKATLYATDNEAILAGAGSGAWRKWYRRLESETIAPEANEIIVTGWDAVRRRPLQSRWVNASAQDPTTPVASRPTNWSGFPVRFGWVDSSITTLDQADSVRDYFVARLTEPRTTAIWESAMLFDSNSVPLWVGDVVELSAHGSYRITTFSADHRHLDYATARYTGELLP